MDLLQVSRSQLISEIYECNKMIYRLINLPIAIRANISSSLLPYMSMICDGIDSLFRTEDKWKEFYDAYQKNKRKFEITY